MPILAVPVTVPTNFAETNGSSICWNTPPGTTQSPSQSRTRRAFVTYSRSTSAATSKTGETFLTYLTRLRLAHVLSDLKRSDGSIQRIAERNGFSNQKSFMRAFRAQFGCTPTELRTRLREGPTLYALQNCSPRFVTG